MNPTTLKGKSHAPILALRITTRDAAGNVLSEEYKRNDLYLWNWAVMIALLFKANFTPTDPTTYAVKTDAGTTMNSGRFTAHHNTSYDDGGGTWYPFHNQWRVQVGTGATAPTIADYKLQTFVKEVQPTTPEIVISNGSNVLRIVFSSTFSFTVETICAETAIKSVRWANKADANGILLTRDTFTPATVPAGGTITLQHELWFNGTP